MNRLRRIYSEILKNEQMSTSDHDLLRAVDTNIIYNKYISKYTDIDQLFKNDSCIIFYDNPETNIGHWCCLTRRGNIVEFFDSYGRNVDDPLYLNGRKPYLKYLLKKSKYRVIYNPYDFQKRGRNIATCGRHVIIRIILKDFTLNQYRDFMHNIDADKFVSFLTLSI